MRSVVAGALLLGALLPAAVDRQDVPEPSAERIAASLSTYSTDGSVNAYRIDRSVEYLVEEVEEGGTQTLTIGSDVMFAFDSAELDAAARGALDALVDDLPQGAAVTVDGHTDARGGDEVNVPLSQARADAVAAAIRERRPDVTTTATGYASSRPVADETRGGDPDYEGMARNRRVEITVTG